MPPENQSRLKKHSYFVKGMHCASCEILIEKRLLEENLEFVEASTAKSEIRVSYLDKRPSVKKLNRIFKKDNYIFSDQKFEKKNNDPLFKINGRKQFVVNKKRLRSFLTTSAIFLSIVIGFLALNKSGLAALISVNSQSALPAFLVFGLLAGFSSCSALVGGIILSMSKQWSQLYSKENSTLVRFKPHLLFNSGRLISYALLGVALGAIGNTLQISLEFTSTLTLVVSVIMILLALQMLGIRAFARFQITTPKFITKFVADENNFQGQWMPFLMGAFTFFLPCGFTITALGLALISASPLQAGLIMLFFALGTLPALLLIGLTTIKFSQKPHFSGQFLKIAGALVLFFAFYNINSQLNVLGITSLNDLNINFSKIDASDNLPPIINGKQIVKMNALAFGYEPDNIRVRTGIPVRWEITDKGTSGCTNAIISKSLFDGQIDLTPGTTSIKEFTPEKPGKYKFSCWMGMISGTIIAIEENSPDGTLKEISSGASSNCGEANQENCIGSCNGGCGNPNCAAK